MTDYTTTDYTPPEYLNKRLRYFHGQFLHAQDFVDEQNYQLDRLRRASSLSIKPGVVEGLEVVIKDADAAQVEVQKGKAVDKDGRQLVLSAPTQLSLAGFSGQMALIALYYAEQETDTAPDGTPGATRFYEAPQVTPVAEDQPLPDAAIPLARLELSVEHKIVGSVDRSVCPPAGARCDGWVRLPFLPQTYRATPGFTLEVTHATSGATGAQGVMAIPIPAGATRIKNVRIAGRGNTGSIVVNVYRGGWNSRTQTIVSESLTTPTNVLSQTFDEIVAITDGLLDPQLHTVAIHVVATKGSDITLVAAEFE
jgi:hypothetical protein